MVLRKMLDKFRSRNEPKKGSEEPDKNSSSNTKKKVRSVRAADMDGIRKAPKKPDHLPFSKSPQQGAAQVPNYMKSTTSHDARKEKTKVAIDHSTPSITTSKHLSSAPRALVKSSSLKLLRRSMKKNKGKNPVTCSSTARVSETPMSVDHNEHHDPLALNKCDYTYCSLHGQRHGAVPSLKRFLSARRKSLKVQKSVKLRVSSIKKKGDKEVEDVVNEFFIEIHSKLQEWGEERSSDDAEIENIVSRMNEMKLESPNDANQLQESCSVTSVEDFGDRNSEISMEDVQVINQFLEFIDKAAIHKVCSQSQNDEENGSVKEVVNSSENEHLESVEEDWATPEAGCERQKDSSVLSRSKRKYSKFRRQSTKCKESVKEFNRRPPPLLALQAEPEHEKVNLKHQSVEERKAAEEWMIDYALRKALRRLTSARKRKVPLLVAAFETVNCCDADAAGNNGPK